jgi:hypothetical protein
VYRKGEGPDIEKGEGPDRERVKGKSQYPAKQGKSSISQQTMQGKALIN